MRRKTVTQLLKNPLPPVRQAPQLKDYVSEVPGVSNLGRAGKYGSPLHSPNQRDARARARQRDEHDSIEGTDFDGEESTQARPPRSKPDGIGELISLGGMVTHFGRKVVKHSPPRSPLSGDPTPGLIRGAAGSGVDSVRNWAGSAPDGPTLSNVLRSARGGNTSAVGAP